MTEKDLLTIALYIATIRGSVPALASMLEQILFTVAEDSLPESKLKLLLELTEVRYYQ